jgi:hypothetical protein
VYLQKYFVISMIKKPPSSQATGYRLQATGYRLQATGYRWLYTFFTPVQNKSFFSPNFPALHLCTFA